jgi:putative spermidine/putrescine transport system ATP-binding protein
MRAEGEKPGEIAVALIGVSKSFGRVVAVHELTLSIRRGEVLTLLGPSGCGKTTLLNLIAGFEEPDAGEIRVDGRDVTREPPHLRDSGMVFQSYALFPHMNVFENVSFGLRMRRRPKAEIAREVGRALEMVKLAGLEGRRVRQLSGGQQQRVALARAIVIRPKVLLLDEPLSALDKNLRAEMQVELKELHDKTGLTTLFVTHDQGEALSLSDRIAVMDKGEIQQIARPIELYEHPANGFVASFIGEINALPAARCLVQGGEICFEWGPGLRLAARQRREQPLRDAERAHLFVRPEHISIGEPGAIAPNRVACRVLTHVYQGAHTLTRVDAGILGILRLRSAGGAVIERLPPGAAVELSIDLDRAVVLPG